MEQDQQRDYAEEAYNREAAQREAEAEEIAAMEERRAEAAAMRLAEPIDPHPIDPTLGTEKAQDEKAERDMDALSEFASKMFGIPRDQVKIEGSEGHWHISACGVNVEEPKENMLWAKGALLGKPFCETAQHAGYPVPAAFTVLMSTRARIGDVGANHAYSACVGCVHALAAAMHVNDPAGACAW